MTGESESEGHAAWVRPHMDWGSIVSRAAIFEQEIDFKLEAPLTLHRAVFFDIGHGVPDAPHLTV
ncbi:hypothetical protein [Parvibaculum sp.]|uniref:hypothetical protein n=1 Tax=Parvibaculum sp. TaxID=2024848 RepID=UPI00391D2282